MQNTRTFTHVNHASAPRSAYASVPRSAPKASPYARLAKKIFHRVRGQLALYLISFYLIPAMLSAGANTFLLTLIYPTICFFLSAFYGLRHGFISHYLGVPVLLYLPASLILFGSYSFLYTLCYLVISCIALTMGALYRQLCK